MEDKRSLNYKEKLFEERKRERCNFQDFDRFFSEQDVPSQPSQPSEQKSSLESSSTLAAAQSKQRFLEGFERVERSGYRRFYVQRLYNRKFDTKSEVTLRSIQFEELYGLPLIKLIPQHEMSLYLCPLKSCGQTYMHHSLKKMVSIMRTHYFCHIPVSDGIVPEGRGYSKFRDCNDVVNYKCPYCCGKFKEIEEVVECAYGHRRKADRTIYSLEEIYAGLNRKYPGVFNCDFESKFMSKGLKKKIPIQQEQAEEFQTDPEDKIIANRNLKHVSKIIQRSEDYVFTKANAKSFHPIQEWFQLSFQDKDITGYIVKLQEQQLLSPEEALFNSRIRDHREASVFHCLLACKLLNAETKLGLFPELEAWYYDQYYVQIKVKPFLFQMTLRYFLRGIYKVPASTKIDFIESLEKLVSHMTQNSFILRNFDPDFIVIFPQQQQQQDESSSDFRFKIINLDSFISQAKEVRVNSPRSFVTQLLSDSRPDLTNRDLIYLHNLQHLYNAILYCLLPKKIHVGSEFICTQLMIKFCSFLEQNFGWRNLKILYEGTLEEVGSIDLNAEMVNSVDLRQVDNFEV